MEAKNDFNSNISEVKNKNEEKEVMSDNILTIPERCQRCRFNLTEIMCKDCYPFIYFCLNCNRYLHSIESKKKHNFINLKEINPDLFKEKENINEKNILEKYNGNSNIDNTTKNYINDIKSLYLLEKQNFIKKISYLENYVEKLKINYNQKIKELEENKNQEITLLAEKHNSEFKNILEAKDSQINFLSQKNEELNKFNEELLSQISEKNKEINKLNELNLNFEKIIQSQKFELELLNGEKNNNKQKIDRINIIFNEEKKAMIKAYEEQIIKINKDYLEHKDKMKEILLQRENEMNDMKNIYNEEIKKLQTELEKFKNANKNLHINMDELNKNKNEHISEIEDLKFQLNNVERKFINECENKKILTNKLEKYQLIFGNLKQRNEYLNNIIFGKNKK